MGCWNESCMISHLPIFYGEDVYGFLLLESPFDQQFCYATGRYSPIAVVRGKYDDYGGIEEIENESVMAPVIQDFLTKSGFSFDGKPVEELDFKELFSTDGQLQQKKWSAMQRYEAKTVRVLVKASILDHLLNAYRENYGHLHARYLSDMGKVWGSLKEAPVVSDPPKDDGAAIAAYLKAMSKRENAEFLFHDVIRMNTSAVMGCNWDSYLGIMSENRELFISYFLLLFESTDVLNYLRMAWHVPSGSGSQDGYNELFSSFLQVYKDTLMDIKFMDEE